MRRLIGEEIELGNEILKYYLDAILENEVERDLQELLFALIKRKRRQLWFLEETIDKKQTKGLSKKEISHSKEAKEYLSKSLKKARKNIELKALQEEELIENIFKLELPCTVEVFYSILMLLCDSDESCSRIYYKAKRDEWQIRTYIRRIKEYYSLPENEMSLSELWKNTALLVDDDITTLNILKAVLSRDFQLQTAQDGEEALKKLKRCYFDLIVSDISMPRMDGIELIKRSLDLFPGIERRFVVVSSFENSNDRDLLCDLKVKYITKPISLLELQRASKSYTN